MERIKKLIVVILCVGMISSLNISFIYASQSNGYHPLNIKIESPDVPKAVTPKRNARSLDSYYSSSELGQVTSVKDQGNTELCWAFGITSMGETSLIKQGIASTNVDFSEKHFGYFMYNRKNDILNNTKGDKTKVSGDWRYAGGNSLLAREGIHISNTTLNSYIHNGIAKLKEFIGDAFKEFVQRAKYLMVDETTELVGVETPEGKAYRRKYLWAFFAKHIKMVYYHYNNGSRSSDTAKSFLEYFMGTISTDGYTVYRMYDGEDSKVLHIGCWTHCRRLWVDALPSDRRAMDIIDPIGDMFRNEDLFRMMKLSSGQIKEKRLKLTGPILERIHHKVVMMMQDAKIMANELMRKAVNYTLNQWKSLRNILKDGSAEISNNLCEQRMKPVKLLLKNCMNIGSEDAAGNSAFIFSLIESCKLNDIDPQDYLKHLFECILHGKDCDKKALLPCFYKSEC